MKSVLQAELCQRLAHSGACPAPSGLFEATPPPILVVIDEAARVEDELLAAVRPMLATSTGGGRLIALTTPAGKRGWFFDAWTGATIGIGRGLRRAIARGSRKRFSMKNCANLGAQRFSEEYGLEFLDPDEAVFPTAIIDAAFTPEVVPLWR